MGGRTSKGVIVPPQVAADENNHYPDRIKGMQFPIHPRVSGAHSGDVAYR